MKLPKKVNAGESMEIQIAPIGEYTGVVVAGDGSQRAVSQLLSLEALRGVLNAWQDGTEILLDADHTSTDPGGSTEAYGWIDSLRVDDELGLMGNTTFTSIGAEAISDRRYRFVSPVFAVAESPDDADSVLATELLSVALTNTPNLPVRCLLNRAAAGITTHVERTKDNNMIAEKLGLAPEATEEEILAAIDALYTRLADAEAEVLNAEAEKVADEEEDKIENRAEFVKLYVRNKDVAKQLLATIRSKPVVQPTVVNTKAAKEPDSMQDPALKIVDEFRNMQPGAEKSAYLAKHKQVLAKHMI